jgi:Zn-dependent M28 family amino/carboxypeptidase
VKTRLAQTAAGTSSDHASFISAGIPAVFIASDDYSKIHTPQDAIGIIDPKLLEDAGDLAYEVIASTLKQVARR